MEGLTLGGGFVIGGYQYLYHLDFFFYLLFSNWSGVGRRNYFLISTLASRRSSG